MGWISGRRLQYFYTGLKNKFYTKSEVDTQLGNVYTKSEVNTKINNVYTKSEIDTKLGNIDFSTLATKEQVGNLNYKALSQTEYDALTTKDENTIYFVYMG